MFTLQQVFNPLQRWVWTVVTLFESLIKELLQFMFMAQYIIARHKLLGMRILEELYSYFILWHFRRGFDVDYNFSNELCFEVLLELFERFLHIVELSRCLCDRKS